MTAACGWDRDFRYSILITEFYQRANTPRSVKVDLEKASSIIRISWPVESSQSEEMILFKLDDSKRPGTGLLSNQITAGLSNQ